MISYKSFLILAAVVVLLGLVLEGTATPANLHRRQKSPPKTVVKTANGNGNSPKKTVAPQPPSPPPPPPVVKTTRSNKAEETTSPAPVPATTSPKTPEETPVFALPQQNSQNGFLEASGTLDLAPISRRMIKTEESVRSAPKHSDKIGTRRSPAKAMHREPSLLPDGI